MITVVSGLPGEGKSLFGVWAIWQQWRVGRCVSTNIELTEDHPAYKDVVEIGTEDYPVEEAGKCFYNYLPCGTVHVIDEADIYWECTNHGRMYEQTRIYFKQHRKRGDDVILIVQRPANLWVKIRRLAGEFIWCHRDGSTDLQGWAGAVMWNIIPKRMHRWHRTSFGSEQMKSQDWLRSAFFYQREAEQLFSWYKSEQLLGSAEWG